MKRALAFLIAMIATVGVAVILPPSALTNISLAWNYPTNVAIKEFHAYYGPKSHAYTNFVVSTKMSTTVSNLLADGDYYFAVTAVNSLGIESTYSDEVTTYVYVPTNTLAQFDIVTSTNILGPWQVLTTNVLSLTNPPGILRFYKLQPRVTRF